MVIYAEAECETCHAIRPKNEMREVQVRRVAGEFSGSARSSNQSNRRSSSFNKSGARFGSGSTTSAGRKSHSRQYVRIERVWVCDGCKDPKSDGAWSWSHYVAVGLAAAALLYWQFGRENAPQTAVNPTEPAATLPPVTAVETGGVHDLAGANDATNIDAGPPQDSGFDEAPPSEQPAAVAASGADAETADDLILQRQLEHTAELRRQGEEEEARIEREAAQQDQAYLERSGQR